MITATLHHISGQNTLLRLILVVQDEDKEVSLLTLTTKLLLCQLDILLQFTDSVFQSGTGVVDLINNQNVLADQIGHLEGAQIQPLSTGNLGTGDFLGITTTEILVQGETDSLDGDVGVTGALEERTMRNKRANSQFCLLFFVREYISSRLYVNSPEDTSRNVTTATNGDHKVRVEVLENGIGRLLAQLVHLDFAVSIFWFIPLRILRSMSITPRMKIMQTAPVLGAYTVVLMHKDFHRVVHTWL